MLTADELKRMRELAMKAAKRPWTCDPWDDFDAYIFITATHPATVLALLDALESARTKIEKVITFLNNKAYRPHTEDCVLSMSADPEFGMCRCGATALNNSVDVLLAELRR